MARGNCNGMNYIENEAAYARARTARIQANARKGRGQRWLAADASRAVLVERLEREASAGFLAKMLEAYREWGSLTDGQESAVRKVFAQRDGAIATRKAADATSQHVGTIGERIVLDAAVSFVTGYESNYGYVTVTGLRDAAGNIYIFKGVPLKLDTTGKVGDANILSYRVAARGDVVKVRATIKAHGERDGARQTIMARPKVESIVTPATPVDVVPAPAPAPAAPAAPRYTADGERIWLVMADRANGTTDAYPQQFASQEAATAALEHIKANTGPFFRGFLEAGDHAYVDRQY